MRKPNFLIIFFKCDSDGRILKWVDVILLRYKKQIFPPKISFF